MEWIDGNLGSRLTMKIRGMHRSRAPAARCCRSRSPRPASTRTPGPRWSIALRTRRAGSSPSRSRRTADLLAALARAPGTLNPYGPRRGALAAASGTGAGTPGAIGLEPPRRTGGRGRPTRPAATGPGPEPPLPLEAPHLVNLVLYPRWLPEQPAGPSRPPSTWTCNGGPRPSWPHRVALRQSGASQAAAVIIDNRSLELLALVGSMQYGPRRGGFDGAAALRSPGSALNRKGSHPKYTNTIDSGCNAPPARIYTRTNKARQNFLDGRWGVDSDGWGPVTFLPWFRGLEREWVCQGTN